MNALKKYDKCTRFDAQFLCLNMQTYQGYVHANMFSFKVYMLGYVKNVASCKRCWPHFSLDRQKLTLALVSRCGFINRYVSSARLSAVKSTSSIINYRRCHAVEFCVLSCKPSRNNCVSSGVISPTWRTVQYQECSVEGGLFCFKVSILKLKMY